MDYINLNEFKVNVETMRIERFPQIMYRRVLMLYLKFQMTLYMYFGMMTLIQMN